MRSFDSAGVDAAVPGWEALPVPCVEPAFWLGGVKVLLSTSWTAAARVRRSAPARSRCRDVPDTEFTDMRSPRDR
ncbi:hypothetical protein ACLBX9_31200 [Methylobacterium sp. A49B]